ncbi:metalloregulator ArsR/SmtB family transcription factor [Hydrogenovibrio sp. 3SP14C1]|uniref:ArsR/SmtB family transcription factor n=1 Tax=Hydrogenovibrio sp. 3SP14C1 TaxID=3038774 RepID=UPI002416D778|nr:metalloregulator ArsR/SmtB family transcription factor [Hydrogenovibrio sp. 3SP14C1]MDG4813535.1 metalloregulator ArsR/SmtB family transcription factor [Hydrogenovibrio sp. 3SP14C1]
MSTVKKQLFEQLALIGQVLSSPQRIELIDYLAQAERNVEELSQLSGLSVANTSRHLQQLKQAGLVSTRKQGKSRFYQLAGADVVSLVKHLRQTAESHLAEVDRLMTTLMPQKNKTEIITSKTLAHEMQKNHLIVLDVRPTKEFDQGHIKGALNIIPEKIDETIETLPKDKTIVAYCRGPYCVYSYQMVEHLRENGRDALRLDEGFPEWKAAGLPYETTLSH